MRGNQHAAFSSQQQREDETKHTLCFSFPEPPSMGGGKSFRGPEATLRKLRKQSEKQQGTTKRGFINTAMIRHKRSRARALWSPQNKP